MLSPPARNVFRWASSGSETGLSRQALYRRMERLGIAVERRLRETE
jgi:hypothetical protein